MVITEQKLDQLRTILGDTPKKIVLLSHTNPDGDTIGAALAWRSYLDRLGHVVRCIAPNRYPYFLEWMTDIGYIGVFKDDADGEMARFISEAEIIFCMDFNQINRLDRVTDTAMANTTATRILIDHHLHPPVDGYAVQFSDTYSCSTSYIVYQLIVALAGEEAIDQAMAEALYVGIMTDTGMVPNEAIDVMSGSDIIIIESNHNKKMLLDNPNYSMFLKKRILSVRGHLSNEECALTILRILQKAYTAQFVLAHLSENNNNPVLAFNEVTSKLREYGVQEGEDIYIDIALQHTVGNIFTIEDRI